MGQAVGQTVGYAIRFKDVTSPATRIKFMTDGLLLKEYLNNGFKAYSVIILDEAHERTLRTDILFGLLKLELKKRPDLRVLVMSATLDANRFSSYFNGYDASLIQSSRAKILNVKGRQYPVRLYHTLTRQKDALDAALVAIIQIHRENKGPGDILVFFTGQEEIESAEKILGEAIKFFPPNMPALLIRPIFAALSNEKQQLVFERTPKGTRKVILSTNIAETSITIPGVTFVVDSGLVKVRDYNSRIGLETLAIEPISKASAGQRMGRAGREAPGFCYRLYTEDSFKELFDTSEPEIKRCNLASVLLLLKASGIKDVVNFDYMDKPSRASLLGALEQLYALGALDKLGELTPIGRLMAEFPLEAQYARVLIASKEFACSQQVIVILASLSVDSLFHTAHDKREQVASVIKKFMNCDGDHLTMYNVIKGYQSEPTKEWCVENYIKTRNVKQVLDVVKQLEDLCTSHGIPLTTTNNNENVIKCFLSGFFMNVALRQQDGSFKTMNNQIVHIHPSSVLFGRKSDAVMFNELVHTKRKYMRNVCVIQGEWLNLVASHFYGKECDDVTQAE